MVGNLLIDRINCYELRFRCGLFVFVDSCFKEATFVSR